MLKSLFHISFDKDLPETLHPRLPDGYVESPDQKETNIPRVSFSPTIEQCFWAIYQNVKQYFEVQKYPYMEFSVYAPVLSHSTKIITNDEVVKRRLVADAHVTGEVMIITPVTVKRVGRVRVLNCLKNQTVLYREFNDPHSPEKVLGHLAKVKLMETSSPVLGPEHLQKSGKYIFNNW